MIEVRIQNEDKSNLIDWRSLNIQKELTNLVDTCSFSILKNKDSYLPEIADEVEIRDKIGDGEQQLQATSNIVQSRDSGGAYTNTTLVGTTYLNIGTITPTKKTYFSRVGVYIVDKGTGSFRVRIRRTSDDKEFAISSISSPNGEGHSTNLTDGGFIYFSVNCILEEGVEYTISVYSSVNGLLLKSQSSNNEATVSYIAEETIKEKTINIISKGETRTFTTENEGVLHNSVIDLDNSQYRFDNVSFGTVGNYRGRNIIYSSEVAGGDYFNYLMIHGVGSYDIRLNGIGTEVVVKVDTIFPAYNVVATGINVSSSARLYSVDYSLNGTDWVNLGRNINYSGFKAIFNAKGNSVFYIKYYKHSTDNSGANYLSSNFSVVADINLGDKIFGGYVTEIEEDLSQVEGGYVKIHCQDYTYGLSGVLVAKSYTGQTAKAIIEDLVSEFVPDFTTTNVVAPTTIAKIVFNQVSVADCLTRISKIIGYEWFVDSNKDIHFFQRFSLTAPFGLTDTGGNYIYKTLKRTIDGTQIANQVKVRGGMGTETSLFEDTITVKGDETLTFKLPYKFADLQVWVNDIEKTVGIDNIHDFTSHDVLYNYQLDSIRFENTLNDGDEVKFAGYKKYPVMAIVSDDASISLIGLREKLVVDNTLEDTTTARERAFLELELAKDAITDCSFRTYENGLECGMTISVGSEKREVGELDYIINRVRFQTRTPEEFDYQVYCSTARKMGLTQFLKELATRGDSFREDESEVAEQIRTDWQDFQISEEIEAIGASEVFEDLEIEEDSLLTDVEPLWVLAPYHPENIEDPKRAGQLSNSFKLT